MSEESIVTIVVAVLGSALLPALINKFKPKSELDTANIENAIKLMKEHELKYEKLEKRFADLEKRYDKVVVENELLEEENDELKRKNRQYQSEIESLKSRVEKLEYDLKKERDGL